MPVEVARAALRRRRVNVLAWMGIVVALVLLIVAFYPSIKGDASLDDTAELLITTARVLSEDIAAWQDLYGRKRLTLPA